MNDKPSQPPDTGPDTRARILAMTPDNRAALAGIMREQRDKIPAQIADLRDKHASLTEWLREFAPDLLAEGAERTRPTAHPFDPADPEEPEFGTCQRPGCGRLWSSHQPGADVACGAGISARCFNGEAGCRVHPMRPAMQTQIADLQGGQS